MPPCASLRTGSSAFSTAASRLARTTTRTQPGPTAEPTPTPSLLDKTRHGMSVKSNETVAVSSFAVRLRLVDPGVGRHDRRVRPVAEPFGVVVVGGGEGVLPGLVDRAGGSEVDGGR